MRSASFSVWLLCCFAGCAGRELGIPLEDAPADLTLSDLATASDLAMPFDGPVASDLRDDDLTAPADLITPADLTPTIDLARPVVDLSSSTVTLSKTSAVADGMDSIDVEITLRDINGQPVIGQTIALQLTGSKNQIVTPPPTDALGRTTGRVSSTHAESKTLSVTLEDGRVLDQRPVLVFVAGPAVALVFVVQPSTVARRVAIKPAVEVGAIDAHGNRTATGTVSISLSQSPAGGVLSGSTAAAPDPIVAHFASLSIDRAGTGYRLLASSAGLASVESIDFEVTHAWYPVNQGIDGGRIEGLALSRKQPGLALVATDGGLFQTRDSGKHWSALGPTEITFSVAYLDGQPEVILISSWDGIQRSVDGGATWQLTAPSLRTRILVVDPKSPSTVYASMDAQLYRSDDGGRSFGRVSGYWGQSIYVIAVDPESPRIYVGALDGLFVSSDGGSSWSRELTAVPGYAIARISIGRGGVGYALRDGILYRYAAGTWTALPPPNVSWIGDIAVDPTDAQRVYTVGPYSKLRRSLDGGTTWTDLGDVLSTGETLTLDPLNPQTLYVGSISASLARSDDGGAHFVLARTGIQAANLTRLAVDSDDRNRIVVGGEGGCFESGDAAASFRPCSIPLQEGTYTLWGLSSDPFRQRILASAWNNVDHGNFAKATGDWTRLDPSSSSARVFGFDATSPNVVWLADGNSLFRSVDQGASFNYARSLSGASVGFVSDPSSQGVLYVLDGNRVIKSSDGGATWKLFGLPMAVGERSNALALDPTQPSRLFVATNNAIYRSLDGGASWSVVRQVWPFTYLTLATHRITGRILVSSYEGLLRSDDGGATFVPANDGLVGIVSAEAVAFDPIDQDMMYLGTSWRGLFKTTTGGL